MLSADEMMRVVEEWLWDAIVCAELVWLLAALESIDASAIFNLEREHGPCGSAGGRRRVWGLALAEHLWTPSFLLDVSVARHQPPTFTITSITALAGSRSTVLFR